MTLCNGAPSIMTKGGLDQGFGGDVYVELFDKVMPY
jgi:hypothetical protein